MTKIIDSISDIISLYDVFILDQWGVMHDGYKGYDHAINAVEKLIKEIAGSYKVAEGKYEAEQRRIAAERAPAARRAA